MLKKTFSFAVFIITCFGFCKAQPALDTITACLKKRPHPFVKLDSRYSFINNELVTIFGIKGGIVFGKKLSFGLGYNQLYSPPKNLNEEVHYINTLGKENTVIKGLHLFYISINAEYTFYQTNHWELGMPLQVGFGQTYYNQYTTFGEKIKSEQKFNFIYEPTISVNYKIRKWFGVGTDFGYRFMLANSRKLSQNLSAPIITFDFQIYYSEIYKSIFSKTKVVAKRL